MDNAITIQDTLVGKLKRYNPKCRNYCVSVAKAVKQARRELIYLGFEHHVDKIIQDYYDLAKLPT